MSNYSKIIHHKYPSLSKLVEAASQPAEHLADINRNSRDKSHDSWAAASFEDACQLATYGWSEGQKRIWELTKQHKAIFDDLLPKQDYQKQISYEVVGESVDVGLAVQGIPESMLQYQETTDTSKIVAGNKLQRIIYQNSYNSHIDKDTVYFYGAAICILINAMELHGFRTELICRTTIQDLKSGNQRLVTDTIIKLFEGSPDYNAQAFAFANGGYFRRLVFGIEEQENEEILRDFNICSHGGYGRAVNYKDDLVTETDIYIPMIERNINFETIIANFRELIERHFKETPQT